MKFKTLGTIVVIIAVAVVLGIVLTRGKVATNGTPQESSSPAVNAPIKITANLAVKDDPVRAKMAQNGLAMAINEINNNGGVEGRPINLETVDSKGAKPNSLSTNLNSQTLTIYLDADIEAVNNGRMLTNSFSTWRRPQPEADLALSYFQKKGIKKIFLITDPVTDSDPVLAAFKKEASRHNVEIIDNATFPRSGEAQDLLAKIKSAKADAVFMDLQDQEIVVPQWAEGFYFALPHKPDATFAETYKLLNKTEPAFGAGAAYDAVYMISRAAADKPVDLDKYMHGTNFKTVGYGNITFDELGGITTPENYYEMRQVKGGKSVVIK